MRGEHIELTARVSTQPWSDGLEGHARVLLPTFTSCEEGASDKEIRKITHTLLDLARKGA